MPHMGKACDRETRMPEGKFNGIFTTKDTKSTKVWKTGRLMVTPGFHRMQVEGSILETPVQDCVVSWSHDRSPKARTRPTSYFVLFVNFVVVYSLCFPMRPRGGCYHMETGLRVRPR